MQLTVRKITKPEACVSVITDWMYSWWGRAEGYTYDEVSCCMAHSLNKVRLPQTYGMFADGALVGMYQFTLCDLECRPDIYPWLANVFIAPARRGLGLSAALISSAVENAAGLGADEIYLYTEHIGLYERFGFEFLEPLDTYVKTPRIQRLYRRTLGGRTADGLGTAASQSIVF